MAGLGSIFGKVLSGGANLGGAARTAFGLRFDVKKWFFDRDRVTKFMDRKNRQALQEAGRRIRRSPGRIREHEDQTVALHKGPAYLKPFARRESRTR